MARTFNGTNDAMQVASTPVASLPLTMSAWVWLNNLSAYYQAIALSASSTGAVVSIQYGNGFGFRAWHNDNANSNQGAYFNTGITSGRWYHLCGVFGSGTSRQIYIDGVLGGSSTGSSGATTINRCLFGARMLSGGTTTADLLPGRLAEVSIWNAALNADEVFSIGKGFRPKVIRPSSLVFYAPMIRNNQDIRDGRTISELGTGTTVSDHPRIIYPC